MGYRITKTLVWGAPREAQKKDKKTGEPTGKTSTIVDIVGFEITRTEDNKKVIMTKDEAIAFIASKGGQIDNAILQQKRTKDGEVVFYIRNLGDTPSLRDPRMIVRIDDNGKVKPEYARLAPERTAPKRAAGASKPSVDVKAIAAQAMEKLQQKGIKLPQF